MIKDFEFIAQSIDSSLMIEEKGVVIQTWTEDKVLRMWIDGRVYAVKMKFIKESEYPE